MTDTTTEANPTSDAIIRQRDEQIRQRDEQIERLSTQLIESTARVAIESRGGIVEGLMPHLKPHLKAFEHPTAKGNYSIGVINPDDPKRPHPTLTVDDVVAKFKIDNTLKVFFEGPAAKKERLITLTAEESKDPTRYKQLKTQKAKGEIDGVIDHMGRRFL